MKLTDTLIDSIWVKSAIYLSVEVKLVREVTEDVYLWLKPRLLDVL